MNVHSSDRPYFCQVPGCDRGAGGKGFKRKNELKRHGLVHESPGYICPYCPEREHKYPRPDNLQRYVVLGVMCSREVWTDTIYRHVRMHHEHEPKDDPKLRAVLEQRPRGAAAGPPRGRKRRISSSAAANGTTATC